MTAPTLVIAIGNPSRGDDALGPVFAARLQEWLDAEGRDDVEVIEDFQLQIEHALDLKGRQQVIFVDAGTPLQPAPYALKPVVPAPDFGHSTHAITPAAVLHVAQQTLGQQLPQASVLCIPGESFELGAALSGNAEIHLSAALRFVQNEVFAGV